MDGDIWDVPPLAQQDFCGVAVATWREAEPLLTGYPCRCQAACRASARPYEPGWLDATTGRDANELGAPVGQAVNAVLLRARREP